MTYTYGEPISDLLRDFFLKHTTEKDCEKVRAKFKNQKSLSLVNKLRQGRYAVNPETEKYVDELFAIAIKNKSKEDTVFDALIKSKNKVS